MKRPDATWLSSPPLARRLSGRRRLAMMVMAGLLLVVLSYQVSAAQSAVLQTQNMTTGLTAENLAETLVGAGGGVTVSNAVFTGADVAAGTFSGGTDIVGFASGIILSTGNIAGVVGPNNNNASTYNQQVGDTELDALATLEGQTGKTQDAAVLTFNFVPDGDNVFFDFVFASEEYPEYVHSDYNDVFAFYVNGTNCALVNGAPVSINTINNANPDASKVTRPPNVAVNPGLYLDNAQPAGGASPRNTQMDGLTRVLTCAAPVNRGVSNTLKLAIADTGDGWYDSTVFIRANSLTTVPPTVTPVPPTITPVPPTVTPVPPVPPATPLIRPDSAGDVHIRTPDGLVYDFQEFGDYILMQSTTGDVKVHARQEAPPNNPRVSVNTAVALWVAGDKLEFYAKDRTFYINDVLTPMPTDMVALPAGGRIELTSGPRTDYTIYWPDGNTGARVILFSSADVFDIGVARLGGSLTYEGVLGDLDGNAQNDIQVRGGELITPPAGIEQLKTFGDSWRVPAEESLFDAPLPVDEAAAAQPPLTLLDLEPAARAEADQTCQAAGVTDLGALHNCTYDVAATGDESFVESAQTQQEAIAQLPAEENVTVAAVAGQRLEVGGQYAVPDAPGTFRYFQLTELPTAAGGPALLALCPGPDMQTIGRVYVNDILSSEAAMAQGLTASNEPCVPVEVAETTDETAAETTDEATTEAPDETVVETTDETTDETTAETTDETAAETTDETTAGTTDETAAETRDEDTTEESAAPADGGGGFCNGILGMPLGLGFAFLALNRRRKR